MSSSSRLSAVHSSSSRSARMRAGSTGRPSSISCSSRTSRSTSTIRSGSPRAAYQSRTPSSSAALAHGSTGTAESRRYDQSSPARQNQPSTISNSVPGQASAPEYSWARMSRARTGRGGNTLRTAMSASGIRTSSPDSRRTTSSGSSVTT